MWFGANDVPPQEVVCHCGATALTEMGATGQYEVPTEEEIAAIPE